MALRGGSSLLRSLARLSNSCILPTARLSSNNRREQTFDLPVLRSPNGLPLGGIRTLRTTPSRRSVSAELSDALKQEIAAEQELANTNGSTLPSFPGFKVDIKEAEVRLTKQYGNESILVIFNVNHSVDISEDDGESQPAPVALPPFTIEITKGEERLCFHLELVEIEDQQGEYDFQVEEFYIAPAVKNNEEDVPSHVYATSGKYIDPSVQELLYVRYLEERGIDSAFLRTLVSFASSHEHRLYINLLNKMKAFIAK